MIETADIIQTIVILIMGVAIYRLVQAVDRANQQISNHTKSQENVNALEIQRVNDLEQEIKQLRRNGENNGSR